MVTPCDLSDIQQVRMSSKIEKNIWQVAKNRIPSGDQVRKRHEPGDDKCV